MFVHTVKQKVETEKMPKRKAMHQFPEEFDFTDDKAKATASQWCTVLIASQDMRDCTSTCKQICFNLGQQWVSCNAVKGAYEETMSAIRDTSLTGMIPKLEFRAVI